MPVCIVSTSLIFPDVTHIHSKCVFGGLSKNTLPKQKQAKQWDGA